MILPLPRSNVELRDECKGEVVYFFFFFCRTSALFSAYHLSFIILVNVPFVRKLYSKSKNIVTLKESSLLITDSVVYT